jgi:hypothetical protein
VTAPCPESPERALKFVAVLFLLVSVAAGPGRGNDDAAPSGPGFAEGDVISFDQIELLRPYLPPVFWDNRDFFFYEGVQLEIGPTQADYSPAEVYVAATERFRGQPRIGPDNSLDNFMAGQPFPMDEIDCREDPLAGVKIMWDHSYQWSGAGAHVSFYYSYWDRGEELPLYYEGTAQGVGLSHRPEPQYLDKNGGDVFRGEKRRGASGPEVEAPAGPCGENE